MYCFDPLCGWCYGFSPVVRKLEQQFGKEVRFSAYAGGMVTGQRVAPIGQTFSYIKDALRTVEERTGVQFGEGFHSLLEKGTYIYNSEPPCQTLVLFKSVCKGSSIAVAHRLQYALFEEGISLNEARNLAAIVEKEGFDKDAFLQLFQQEKYCTKTYEEFAFVQQLGVSGFPTLIYREGNKAHALSRGYQDYNILEDKVSQLVKRGAAG